MSTKNFDCHLCKHRNISKLCDHCALERKCNHLERQLAEAREELGKEIKKAQDFEFAYNHTYDLKCYWESMYNKLKEQG